MDKATTFDDGVLDGTMVAGEASDSADVSQGNALAIFSAEFQFDSDDIVFPRLSLSQGLSNAVQEGLAKPGQWYLVGQEAADELTVIPVLMAKRRELLTSEFDRLCVSEDSLVGIGEPGGQCSACPKAGWTGGRDSRKPPECTLIYSYICYVPEYQTLAQLDLKRTSAPTAKIINTILMQKGVGNIGVVLGSRSQQSTFGKFYVATVKPAQIDEDILDLARSLVS